jgi:O-antigen/teichoic acid export membrane protein
MGVRRALVFSGLDRYSVFAINFLMLAVAARLLSPRDVGIFTVSHTLVMMAGAFRDFGVNSYVIQAPKIVREDVQTSFTISIILSSFAGCAFFALSGFIARLYAEPGLASVIKIAAAIFLIDTFFYPQYALLKREMAFAAIFVIDVGSSAAQLVTFYVLAVLGSRYMSLAWGSLANALAALGLTLALRPYFWAYRPNLYDWKKFLNFGGYFAAFGVLTVFFASLPQLIIGRVLNFTAAGLYSRATILCQVPERLIISVLQPVLLPAFAARLRDGGDLKEPYLRGLGLMSAVQWPLLLCAAFLADPIVRLVLGQQWLAVAPLLRVMALASLAMLPVFSTYPLLASLGHTKDMFLSSLLAMAPSGLLIVLASKISLQAVAASMIITAPLQGYVALRFVRRRVPFAWGELVAATRKSAWVALSTCVIPAVAIALYGFRFDLPLSIAFIAGLGAAVGWLAGLRLAGHPLLTEEMRGAAHQLASAFRTFARRLSVRTG